MISMKDNQKYSHFTIHTDTSSSSACAILPNSTDDRQEPVNDHFSGEGSDHNFELDRTNDQDSVKWISSKMRFMDKILVKKHRKTGSLQPDHASSSINDPVNEIIRICSSCKTTKTPLWRSGPQGPKSLCNACGIRQMKARRAMRAAVERSNMDRTVPFKKRFKFNVNSSSSQKKLKFEDIAISLSGKLAFQQAFPQEEKDAAMLLMALSCGFVHG